MLHLLKLCFVLYLGKCVYVVDDYYMTCNTVSAFKKHSVLYIYIYICINGSLLVCDMTINCYFTAFFPKLDHTHI